MTKTATPPAAKPNPAPKGAQAGQAAKSAPEGTVEVLALKQGFYGGNLVKMGATFFVQKGEKAAWFTPTKPIQGAKVEALSPEEQAAVAANAAAATTQVGLDPASGKLDTMTAGSGQHVDLA